MEIPSNAKVYPWAKIVGNMECFQLGALAQIDDFVFINIGQKCVIGRNVHIASFSSIIGGGECIIKDFAGLSAGCRLVTGSDDFTGGYMTNPTVPSIYTNVKCGSIAIGRHAILGTNVIVFPNVCIGEGAAVGAGCIVREDLEPWTVYAGTNTRRVTSRDRNAILSREKEYLRSLSITS